MSKRERFSFAVTSCPADLSELDEMMAENIHRFSQAISYVEASMIGGKMTPEEAMHRIKDGYKALKSNNKNLKLKN